jgi:hypothetical protein
MAPRSGELPRPWHKEMLTPMQAQPTARPLRSEHSPDWATGRDREREREEVREDQWLRTIEAGETPAVVTINQEWSTLAEVAKRHGCAAKTIRQHRLDGTLKAHCINPQAPEKSRRYRVHRDDELVWVEGKRPRR